jgi:transcriptional antiterminator
MDVENSFIKPVLLSYFSKGISVLDAREEIAKKYGPYGITLKTIRKWFGIFRDESLEFNGSGGKFRKKFTDKFLIDLINDNPGLNMNELGRLAGTSQSNISRRLKLINNKGKKAKYVTKRVLNEKMKSYVTQQKFSDDFLIDLVNENPDLCIRELAILANVSNSTIVNRLKQINKGSVRVNYIKKEAKFIEKKFSDEFLINLVNENPDLSVAGLARLAEVSDKTVYRRLKQINSVEKRVNYVKKTYLKGEALFTDEYLIDLVNSNPDLNMKELAMLANVTERTISRRIKEVNSHGKRINYVFKRLRKGELKFTDEYLIDLVNNNPELNMKQLANLANSSESYISTRLKLISIKGEKVNYSNKHSLKGTAKQTDEFIIRIVEENPSLNMTELSKLVGISASTISRRLKHINSNSESDSKVKLQNIKTTAVNNITDENLINLVNENPGFSIPKLAELLNTSSSAISRKLKQINSGGKKVNYTAKNLKKGEKKFSDERLIELIKSNPDLNMAELAKLAESSISTISVRLKEINSNGEKVAYSKKNYKKGLTKITDEYLTNLSNENPDLNNKELSKLAGISASTISRRLKQIKNADKE